MRGEREGWNGRGGECVEVVGLGGGEGRALMGGYLKFDISDLKGGMGGMAKGGVLG